MTGPRDPVPQLAVPVDFETGLPLTDRQKGHLQALREAGEALYEAMHTGEGSNPPPEHQDHVWGSRAMSIAATHIETGLMYARKAVLK